MDVSFLCGSSGQLYLGTIKEQYWESEIVQCHETQYIIFFYQDTMKKIVIFRIIMYRKRFNASIFKVFSEREKDKNRVGTIFLIGISTDQKSSSFIVFQKETIFSHFCLMTRDLKKKFAWKVRIIATYFFPFERAEGCGCYG